jgi:hypothetical protein
MKYLACTLAILIGCGDDGGGHNTVDAPKTIDGKSIDAPPMITGPIVGSWNRDPNQDQTIGFASITFNTDGTILEMDPGKPDGTGTYSLPSAGRVLLTHTPGMGSGSDSGPIETDYVATSDHLLITAFMPVGTVNGFVGTWHNSTTTNGATQTIDIALAANNTATFTSTTSQGTIPITGTWAANPVGFTFTGTSLSVTLKFVPIGANQAIGYLAFVKA